MGNNYNSTENVPDTARRHWRNRSSAAPFSFIERGEKSPSLDTLVKLANALDISVDILFGKELKNYTSEKLKYIESQLKNLPSLEQQKVLDIMDSVVAVELSYHNEKGLQKKC